MLAFNGPLNVGEHPANWTSCPIRFKVKSILGPHINVTSKPPSGKSSHLCQSIIVSVRRHLCLPRLSISKIAWEDLAKSV